MPRPLELVWVWAALAIPSWALVYRFLGLAGIVIHSIAIVAALLLAPRIFGALKGARVAVLGMATAAILVILFAAAFPRLNVHTPGAGSDDDDAHDVGVAALIAGESPYARQTYLGNELHQLPGAYLLAAPFALLGTSALQNLVWLPLFFVILGRGTRDPRTPLTLAWLVLLLSVVTIHQVITGSSYSWNAISVFAGIWWVMSRPASVPAALFLGVALCSRANFLLLLPLLFGWLARSHGRTAALKAIAVASITVVILVLPFVAGPRFGPLDAADRLLAFDYLVSGSSIVMAASTAVLALALAFVPTDRAGFFLQCAAVQAWPILLGLLIATQAYEENGGLFITPYGLFAAWFALAGAALRLEPWLLLRQGYGGQVASGQSTRLAPM
jgi:hypothetical protein